MDSETDITCSDINIVRKSFLLFEISYIRVSFNFPDAGMMLDDMYIPGMA